MDEIQLIADDNPRKIEDIVNMTRDKINIMFKAADDEAKGDIFMEAVMATTESGIKKILYKIAEYEPSDSMLNDVMDAFILCLERRQWDESYEEVFSKRTSLGSAIDYCKTSVSEDCYLNIINKFADIAGKKDINEAKSAMKEAIGDIKSKEVCENLFDKVGRDIMEGDDEEKEKRKEEMLDEYFFILLEEAFNWAEEKRWKDNA